AVHLPVHFAAESGAGDIEEMALLAVVSQQAEVSQARLRVSDPPGGDFGREGDADTPRPIARGSYRHLAIDYRRAVRILSIEGDNRIHPGLMGPIATVGNHTGEASRIGFVQMGSDFVRLLRDSDPQFAEAFPQQRFQLAPDSCGLAPA